MSKDNPGVIFDASNSWNGYNHQGKLAILFVIKQILEVYDRSRSLDENKEILADYFVEIEYLEDFSLGQTISGKDEYYYVHQVKNHATNIASGYDSALMGLAYHVKNMPTLKNAYLHVTTEVDFKENTVQEYIKKLIASPKALDDILDQIDDARKDSMKKQDLYAKRKGRPDSFRAKLKKALIEEDNTQREIGAKNIDLALDSLEKQIKNQIRDIKLLSNDQMMKIDLFLYDIDGQTQSYCAVNQIEQLIKDEIYRSINELGLPQLWLNERYINNRYLYLLGKLDEHIIDRNLNYPLYVSNSLDRKIRLNQVLEWLTSDLIDTADENFFQYQLKNIFSEYMNEYCQSHCPKSNSEKCDTCLLVSAINKIGEMTSIEMKDFLVLTCPSNNSGLSVKTFSEYLSKRKIRDPFLKGISEINIPFEENKRAITYIGKETLQYILTTLESDVDEDNEGICTDIVRNKELFELLMDYDCFISKNISCKSIQDKARKLGNCPVENEELEERRKEHIAHLKDVGIITLEDFEKTL